MLKITLSIIISGISLGIIFGYVKPTYDEVGQIKAGTAQYNKALSKAEEIQVLRQTLLSQYNLFTDNNRLKLEKLLPDNVDNVRLVLDIDGMATARGIRIGSVKIEEKKDSKTTVQTTNSVGFTTAESEVQKYETLTLRFSTTAPYQEFKQFLQDLEHSLRIVDLVELNISQAGYPQFGGNDISPALYKFDVAIKTYWLK